MELKEREDAQREVFLPPKGEQEVTAWLAEEQSDDTADWNEELRLMQEENAHVTSAIVQHLLLEPEAETVQTVVVPHLCRCSWCRSTVDQALELSNIPANHPAQRLLAQAEDWAKWSAAGKQATQAARTALHGQGLPVVTSRDGAVWEEDAEGTVRRVAERETREALRP